MDFDHVIKTLNELLTNQNPATFNSSWIRKHAPHCYRFIYKNIRTELGRIDWDRITLAMEWKFQRRWKPGRKLKSRPLYEDHSEVAAILDKYQEKLYTFTAPEDKNDKRIRDTISISLVRLAQYGNMSAKHKLMNFVRYTIDDWIERYHCLSRWQGYEDEIQKRLETCIRLYRYTGSFLNYVFRTLLYAGRGLRPFYVYSLDEPIAYGSVKSKIENVIQDAETQEIRIFNRAQYGV